MMRRLLFVDHYYHSVTQSSLFFKEILRRKFEVIDIYIRPGFLPDFQSFSCDIVMLWQIDYLAPSFLARGVPTVVVQMFDGSSNLSDNYWRICRQARFLNFSLSLHARALYNSVKSLPVRYFPNADTFRQVDDFATLRLFYWRRLNAPEFSLERLAAMLAGRLDSIHVHLAHDPDNASPEPDALEDLFRCQVSTSNWLAEKADYDRIVDSCNIYFAPRYAEGIGHSFLDSMARGMVTIAYDLPTHNEYISNWKTGILFNSLSNTIDLEKIRALGPRIGSDARSFVSDGHRAWLESQTAILDFIDETEVPVYPNYDQLRDEADQMAIRLIKGRTGEDFFTTFPVTANLLSAVHQTSDRDSHSDPYWAKNINIVFGEGNYTDFIGPGWSAPEQTHIWAVDLRALVYFDMPVFDREPFLQIEVRSASSEKDLLIHIDGELLARISIDSALRTFSFPLGLLQAGIRELRLEVLRLDTAPSDSRTLAFLCRSIRVGVFPLESK